MRVRLPLRIVSVAVVTAVGYLALAPLVLLAITSVGIDGIIIRQAGRLDWDYVRSQLAPLAELKDAPELAGRLDQRRAELDR